MEKGRGACVCDEAWISRRRGVCVSVQGEFFCSKTEYRPLDPT